MKGQTTNQLREAARQQLRDEYKKLRDAKVKLWQSGRSLDEARKGPKK